MIPVCPKTITISMHIYICELANTTVLEVLFRTSKYLKFLSIQNIILSSKATGIFLKLINKEIDSSLLTVEECVPFTVKFIKVKYITI